ncbi:MAG: hypothetical protein ABIR68_03560 [Ilumatobacteraceae bacterium]
MLELPLTLAEVRDVVTRICSAGGRSGGRPIQEAEVMEDALPDEQ